MRGRKHELQKLLETFLAKDRKELLPREDAIISFVYRDVYLSERIPWRNEIGM